MAKEIQLTQGKVAIVDDEMYDYLNQWKWHVSNDNYARRTIKNQSLFIAVFMHREIMKVTKGYVVDHINQCKLDNRIINLRICTNSQNSMNRVKNINNSSGYKGVSFNNSSKKWRAQIWLNSKSYHLGLFIDAKDAARAYNEAAVKYHGEFANLNKID
jgi:hypothetical protein